MVYLLTQKIEFSFLELFMKGGEGGALNFTWLLFELSCQDECLERCEVAALSFLVHPISMLYLASLLQFTETILSCTKDSSFFFFTIS